MSIDERTTIAFNRFSRGAEKILTSEIPIALRYAGLSATTNKNVKAMFPLGIDKNTFFNLVSQKYAPDIACSVGHANNPPTNSVVGVRGPEPIVASNAVIGSFVSVDTLKLLGITDTIPIPHTDEAAILQQCSKFLEYYKYSHDIVKDNFQVKGGEDELKESLATAKFYTGKLFTGVDVQVMTITVPLRQLEEEQKHEKESTAQMKGMIRGPEYIFIQLAGASFLPSPFDVLSKEAVQQLGLDKICIIAREAYYVGSGSELAAGTDGSKLTPKGFALSLCMDFNVKALFESLLGEYANTIVRLSCSFNCVSNIKSALHDQEPLFTVRIQPATDAKPWTIANGVIDLRSIELSIQRCFNKRIKLGFKATSILNIDFDESSSSPADEKKPTILEISGSIQSTKSYSFAGTLLNARIGILQINKLQVSAVVEEGNVTVGLQFELDLGDEVILKFDGDWHQKTKEINFTAKLSRLGFKEIKRFCGLIVNGTTTGSENLFSVPAALEAVALTDIVIEYKNKNLKAKFRVAPWQTEESKTESIIEFSSAEIHVSIGIPLKELTKDAGFTDLGSFVTAESLIIDFRRTFKQDSPNSDQPPPKPPGTQLIAQLRNVKFSGISVVISSATFSPIGDSRFVRATVPLIKVAMSEIDPSLTFLDIECSNIAVSYNFGIKETTFDLDGSSATIVPTGFNFSGDIAPAVLKAIFGDNFVLHMQLHRFKDPAKETWENTFTGTFSNMKFPDSLKFSDSEPPLKLIATPRNSLALVYTVPLSIRGTPLVLQFSVDTNAVVTAEALTEIPLGRTIKLTRVSATVDIKATAFELGGTITFGKQAKLSAAVRIGRAALPGFWIKLSDVQGLSELIDFFVDLAQQPKTEAFTALDSMIQIQEVAAGYAPLGITLPLPSLGGLKPMDLVGEGIALSADLTLFGNRFIGLFIMDVTKVLMRAEIEKPWSLWGLKLSSHSDRMKGPKMHLSFEVKQMDKFDFGLDCHLTVVEGFLEGGVTLIINPQQVYCDLELILWGLRLQANILVQKDIVAVKIVIGEEHKKSIRSRAALKLKEEAKKAAEEAKRISAEYKKATEEAIQSYNAALKELEVAAGHLDEASDQLDDLKSIETKFMGQLEEAASQTSKRLAEFEDVIDKHQGYDKVYGALQQLTDEQSKLKGDADKTLLDQREKQKAVQSELEGFEKQTNAAALKLNEADKSVPLCKTQLETANRAVGDAQRNLDNYPLKERSAFEYKDGKDTKVDEGKYNEMCRQHNAAQENLNNARRNVDAAQDRLNIAIRELGEAKSVVENGKKEVTGRLEPLNKKIQELEAAIKNYASIISQLLDVINGKQFNDSTSRLSYHKWQNETLVSHEALVKMQISANEDLAKKYKGELEAQLKKINDVLGTTMAKHRSITFTQPEELKDIKNLITLTTDSSDAPSAGLKHLAEMGPSVNDIREQLQAAKAQTLDTVVGVFSTFRACQQYCTHAEYLYPQVIGDLIAAATAPSVAANNNNISAPALRANLAFSNVLAPSTVNASALATTPEIVSLIRNVEAPQPVEQLTTAPRRIATIRKAIANKLSLSVSAASLVRIQPAPFIFNENSVALPVMNTFSTRAIAPLASKAFPSHVQPNSGLPIVGLAACNVPEVHSLMPAATLATAPALLMADAPPTMAATAEAGPVGSHTDDISNARFPSNVLPANFESIEARLKQMNDSFNVYSGESDNFTPMGDPTDKEAITAEVSKKWSKACEYIATVRAATASLQNLRKVFDGIDLLESKYLPVFEVAASVANSLSSKKEDAFVTDPVTSQQLITLLRFGDDGLKAYARVYQHIDFMSQILGVDSQLDKTINRLNAIRAGLVEAPLCKPNAYAANLAQVFVAANATPSQNLPTTVSAVVNSRLNLHNLVFVTESVPANNKPTDPVDNVSNIAIGTPVFVFNSSTHAAVSQVARILGSRMSRDGGFDAFFPTLEQEQKLLQKKLEEAAVKSQSLLELSNKAAKLQTQTVQQTAGLVSKDKVILDAILQGDIMKSVSNVLKEEESLIACSKETLHVIDDLQSTVESVSSRIKNLATGGSVVSNAKREYSAVESAMKSHFEALMKSSVLEMEKFEKSMKNYSDALAQVVDLDVQLTEEKEENDAFFWIKFNQPLTIVGIFVSGGFYFSLSADGVIIMNINLGLLGTIRIRIHFAFDFKVEIGSVEGAVDRTLENGVKEAPGKIREECSK